jgi:nucleoside-diphosphate-sugar epimerase
LNLPYAEWQPGMLTLTDHVVEASQLSGATIVFPGNVYGLKPIYGVPLPPDAPTLDVSDRPNKKGNIRNMLEDHLAQHSELNNIRSIIVRAADFYGPGVDNGLVGPMFRGPLTGKPVPWYADRATQHPFVYIDDVASAAVGVLLTEGRPTFEIVGVGCDAFTGDEWAAALGKAAGKPATLKVVPHWQVKLMGIFNREAREFGELLYQWDGPLMLDEARTKRILPDWQRTPVEDALAATMAWFNR